MNAKQAERLVVSFEKIASSLDSIAKIQKELHFPKETAPPPAEVYHRGERKPEPQSPEDYTAFPSDQPGKYETLIRKQNPQGRRTKKS